LHNLMSRLISKPAAALAGLAVLAAPSLAHAAAGGNFEEALAAGWLWAFLLSFGFGFLTSLTPCVYPMIPIVVGVFGARGESVTRRTAFALASCYVLGMATLYTILGVVFAFIGRETGTLLAEPAVVLPLVAIYLALAASMFGAFDLQLPQSLQNRLNAVGGKGYGGAFGMGMVGGITAAPCTGPFIAGMIGFVASTQNIAAGGALMFVYALGMGVLFWVLAVFTVALPRSGKWMESVKSVGGIALIGVALYFLRPVVPALARFVDTSQAFLVGAVAAVVVGFAIGAAHLSFKGTGAAIRLRKALGVVLVAGGGFAAVNWAVTADRHLPWRTDEAAAFAEAREQGKGVMVDFAAEWCTPCLQLENTFAAPGVYEEIVGGYIPLRLDVTRQNDANDELQARFNATTLPAVIFLDAERNELARVSAYVGPDDFLEVIEAAGEAARRRAQAP
jgi:thiol:disulfide interchange protein DsbD